MRFNFLPEVGDEVIVGITFPKLDGTDKQNAYVVHASFTPPIGSNKGSRSARNELAIETLE